MGKQATKGTPREPEVPEKEHYERLSSFRWQLRRFLRFSEDACREEGVTMLHYQLLLHTQGFAGRDWASIGELADRLQAQPHGVVALVTRCEQSGLVERRASARDGRLVEVHLTVAGRRCLRRLAQKHREELASLAAVVDAASDL
ncbi:MarR family winged helix-turn-helix transcriptional regulator [Ramlibacter sp. Leaf400]|uniref:MarR family winged helix-turn-helix transcriptional regulator n=1 Tax=Ramlibacter sp. Leaf400 TaxID=1736365 RepID=UPI0006F91129|nr:MarR family transcriptional regulator [Ramlibacter sp. Leaf400]KQT09355.1 MarR family transcriptional regulator [Ramlibacter sp. Leaf400]